MTDDLDTLPDPVTLDWLGKNLLAFRKETKQSFHTLRGDVDMLIRTAARLDHSVNAMREDVNALWLDKRDLRRRIETLEGTEQ